MATSAIQKIDNLIKYVHDNISDDSKSQPCPSTAPCEDSTVYTPVGVTKTLSAIKGSKSNLSDIEVYYSSQPKQNIKNAVVILYDIFGWNSKNKNVFEFCDRIAAQGNGQWIALMPDFFRGNPWPVNKEITMEEIMKWKNKTATFDIVLDDMKNRILPSLQANGIENICFVGQCWGGNIGFRLGECNNNNIDAKTNNMFVGLVSIHGSMITDELCNKMSIPVCYCPTPKDQPVEPVKNILDKKGFGGQCVYKAYDKMFHGFTGGRGDYKKKEIKEAVNDVLNLSLKFFNSVFGVNDGVLGGMKEADRKELIDAANAVRSEVEKRAGDDEKFECYEVVSGSKQVVAGMNYEIKVKYGENKYANMKVYRSLPPFKYELKSVEFTGGDSGATKLGGFKTGEKDELIAAANAVKNEVQSRDDEKFTCYEVVSGSKQVVAGMNYQIKVKVGENKFAEIKVYRSLPPVKYELKSVVFVTTEAPKLGGWGAVAEKQELTDAASAVKSEVEKQASDMGKPIKMYEVEEGRKQVVAGMNYKIKIKIDKNRYCEVKVYRSLPPVSYELKNVIFIEPEASKTLIGGFKQADKDELTAAANEVKDEVQNMDDEKFTCYEVVSGTKQVVAGMNYQIKVQVGTNKYAQIKVYRSLPPVKYELKSAVFVTTETPILGGWGKAADKQEMEDAANAVKSQIEKQGNDMGKPIKMYEVQQGRKQVVAGMNFKIKIKVGENRFCEIKVYRSLPPISYELKSVVWIEPRPSPKVGGFNPADKDELTAAANAVKDEVQSRDDEKFTCYEVVSGSKQVVAGMNYRIKVKVGENKFADIKVYRSLPPVKYELKSVAFVTSEAPKLGGWGSVAEKQELTDAANAVKSEVEKQANDMGKPIKMYEVQEGRKQVVAGMNYKIKIKVDENRYCEIKVYRSLPPVSYELKNVIWTES